MKISQTEILLLLHITFLAFFLGGQFFYLFIIQPASFRFFSVNDQVFYLQNVLKRQNPILLLVLCLVVITGGLMITGLKTSLGTSYFSAFGSKLVTKLGYFFIVFFITAYQSLAIGFKIRYLDAAKQGQNLAATLKSVRTQMSITSVLNILLTVFIIYIARNYVG